MVGVAPVGGVVVEFGVCLEGVEVVEGVGVWVSGWRGVVDGLAADPAGRISLLALVSEVC